MRTFRTALVGALATAWLLPAAVSAAPTLTPSTQIPYLKSGEEAPETAQYAVAGSRTNGDVWAATKVFRWVPDGTGDSTIQGVNVIRRFTPAGTIVKSFEAADQSGAVEYLMDLDLSLDGQTLYVPVEQTAKGVHSTLGVRRISATDGTVLGAFATTGSAGGFDYLRSVDVAPDGDVYVGGYDKSASGLVARLRRFSAAGIYKSDVALANTTSAGGAPAFDFRNGDLLIGDGTAADPHIDRYSSTLGFRSRFGSASPQGGNLDEAPGRLAVNAQNGAVYGAAYDSATIRVWAANGGFAAAVTAPVGNPPQTRSIQALASHPDGSGVWAFRYRGPIQWFAAGDDGKPDPTPEAQPAEPKPVEAKPSDSDSDSDGDGVSDGADKCPSVAAATADGCPVAQSTAQKDEKSQTSDGAATPPAPTPPSGLLPFGALSLGEQLLLLTETAKQAAGTRASATVAANGGFGLGRVDAVPFARTLQVLATTPANLLPRLSRAAKVRKPTSVGDARQSVPAGKTATIRARLNAEGRRMLKRRGSLKVRVTVLVSSAAGKRSASRTITLRRRAAGRT